MKSIPFKYLRAFSLEDQIDHPLHHTGSALLRQRKKYIFNPHFAYGLANPAGAHSVSTIDSTNRYGSTGNLVRQRFTTKTYVGSIVDSSSSIFANLTRTGKNSTMEHQIPVQPSSSARLMEHSRVSGSLNFIYA